MLTALARLVLSALSGVLGLLARLLLSATLLLPGLLLAAALLMLGIVRIIRALCHGLSPFKPAPRLSM
jgi:hypothetical protein